MEQVVRIQEVGAYSERQYNRQDGSTEYPKEVPYIVKGFWKHREWQDKNGDKRHENSFYITDLQQV